MGAQRWAFKAGSDTAVGMVIGGLITGAIAASAGPCYTAQCTNARTDLLESGMQAGAVAGRIRYSPEMELEADQLATYIVREAGYDLRAARKLFIRMARAEQQAAAQGQRGLVGFLKTHPTDARRIAH